MKRVLFICNIQVPYRVRFFNALAEHCHLTVLYESRGCGQRDPRWAGSENSRFRVCYFGKNTISLLEAPWDAVILGCYHTPRQILIGAYLRLRGKSYTISLDGEPFLEGRGWKARCKRWLLSWAKNYLAAGNMAADALKKTVGAKGVTAYPFSALSEEEIPLRPVSDGRHQRILVVGQYFPYKGMDVALEAARRDSRLEYCFVGMGSRTERFRREQSIPPNVRLIPFLQKEELRREMARCALLVLPSRRECWGLVVNEAAALGTAVVSTWGSGAAVEFLGRERPQFLATPADPEDLLRCIHDCLRCDRAAYGAFLQEKSRNYTIEAMVRAHLQFLEGESL